MTFLTTSECASLPQAGGPQRTTAPSNMGGLITMRELTSLKNYYVAPPGMAGLGQTLVDTAVRETPSQPIPVSDRVIQAPPRKRRGRGRGPRQQGQGQGQGRGPRGRGPGTIFEQLKAQGLCTEEVSAAQAARKNLMECAKKNMGYAEPQTSQRVSASEGSIMAGLSGKPVPIKDLVHGEYDHASQMLRLPQAFGGMGSAPMGRPVPRRDFVRGEIVGSGTLVDHAQGFGALPVADLAPGEYTSPGSLVSPHKTLRLPNGKPGSYHGQYGVPYADLKRGELERAALIARQPQQFGDWIPITSGGTGKATQGTYLAPSQVPAWDRESGATLASQKQNFGGLGQTVPKKDFVKGELEEAALMSSQPQFFGMGDYVPFKQGPAPAASQGTWLSPSQVPSWDLESGAKLASEPQNFGELGQAVPRRDLVPGELTPASAVSGPQSFGGLGQNYTGKLNLSPICDPGTGTCISYATPAEIQAAIGQKVEGKSALVKSQFKLPSFYDHPQLGPWGVDPRVAYQYWWQQQAAMQQAATPAPMSIWGSPGYVAPTPPLQASGQAQAAAFDPYSDSYPVAGTAVERF